ncbi:MULTISPECIES: hypothetical protein [unclassified Legionella]|uniref:hypothetical protein n=1 Tax=unclassified Legionella TaxID=2622702 RepID=UPI001E4F4099|nr:hypothetical protein [Legionella sp. 31fI33]MCC5016274.1 hypothetical protein [Legionella sp. 31fI33]
MMTNLFSSLITLHSKAYLFLVDSLFTPLNHQLNAKKLEYFRCVGIDIAIVLL